LDSSLDVHGVPKRDGGRDESKAASPIALLLKAPVSDFAEAAEEDGSGERISGFALVETGVNAAA